jgi:hypothetical protein
MTNELAVIDNKTTFRHLTVAQLNDLGYELTGRQSAIGSKPVKYALMEVKDEDSRDTAGFCYLFAIKQQTGIILANPFFYYLRFPEKLFSEQLSYDISQLGDK